MALIRPGEVVNTGIARGTPASVRFDVQLIAPNVNAAEIRYIMPVLGRPLFDAMAAAQFSGDSNYNPAFPAQNKFANPAFEALWYPYLLELCARSVLLVSLPGIALQVAAGGVFRNSSEYGDGASVKDIKFLSDAWTQDIAALQDEVLRFLCENKDNYPLFDSTRCGGCNTGLDTAVNFGLVFD
jgi:hypothetical protein